MTTLCLYNSNKKRKFCINLKEEFIKNKTNNHFYCNFNNEISNFYKIDGHPNKKGYQTLYECVSNIMHLNLE